MAAKTLAPSSFRGLQDELKTSEEVHKKGEREMRHTVGVGWHNCPATNSYKATTKVWSVLIRGIISLPIGALVIGVAAILFGAPVSIDSLWKTATWSIFMSTLIVLPTACCKGASWDDWIRLFAQTRPLGAVEILLCIPAHGAAIGAWIGAWPMPLDWAQPWQEWPICCTYGSVAGYLVGLLLALGFIVMRKPEQFWHLKKL
ncbi:hypothetical protein CBR_g41678 [Chara braunii]|uniref:Uncharacterized protein n=1 Tax=Chara braunii TaxID=69332 RepID=A0A388LWB6_CHABU|nr:hypothetical protein CBR_g41678 [Chara braunii]|eukprot:GBG86614.1 hypothetical protein CBR_g41678 [Chara braunii]